MNPSRFAFLPLLLLAAPLCAQGELDLRSTAKKDSSVWLLLEEKQESSTDVAGQTMEQGQTTKRVVHVTVKDVDDKGNLIVETLVARVFGEVTMPMGMGDVEFDSAKPEAADEEDDGMGMGMNPGAMKKMLLSGAGKTFKATVSPFGKVVSLPEDAKQAPGTGGIGEEAMRDIVEAAFGLLPDKPVAVGGKWQHLDQERSRQAPVDVKVEMTLVKADDEVFEITGTGTVEKAAKKEGEAAPKIEGVPEEQQEMVEEMLKGMSVKNGKFAGSQKVSRKDGFVVDATKTVTLDIEMSMGGMDIVTSVKSTNTIKRTTADASQPAKKEEPKKEEAKEPAKEAGK